MDNFNVQYGPEWTSTHQCTNMDGWCANRILFSIPIPSQVDFFCLPFLSPFSDQPWSLFSFATLFSPPPLPRFFFPLISVFFETLFSLHPPPDFYFFGFWNFSHPPTYSPIYLKLKVDSSPSTYSPKNLKCATLIPTHLLALPLS